MLHIKSIYRSTALLMVALTAIVMSSCSMMTEDLPECVTTVSVVFKYDYNIQRADMFHDHVGSVRLFVVDNETNQVVKDTTVSNRDDYNAISINKDRYYTMQLSGITPGRSYRFVAYALQRPYDETQRQGSDNFTGIFPELGQQADKFKMSLTYNATPDSEERYAVKAPSCGLDTLWMGHTDKAVYVPVAKYENYSIVDTISMVRDTKYLQLLLHQTDAPTEISSDDFEVEIVDANANLDWNNDVLSSPNLLYTPHFSRTLETIGKVDGGDDGVVERTAFYEISFSRLIHYMGADFGKNARLRIIRKATDYSSRQVVADLNLPSVLSEGRSQYAWYNYGEQEYLDREYNYRLDFYLLGGKIRDIYLVSMNITPWAIRIQDEKF